MRYFLVRTAGGYRWGDSFHRRRLTLSRRRLTLNRRRLTLSRRRLTLNRRRLTLNRRRLTLSRRRLTLSRRRLTLNRRRLALNRRRLADDFVADDSFFFWPYRPPWCLCCVCTCAHTSGVKPAFGGRLEAPCPLWGSLTSRGAVANHPPPQGGPLGTSFFFWLSTALKDRPKGPPTANRDQPPTANRQRRPTASRQPLPTATNHQSPTTNRRQPPPTATNRQSPIANHQSPPPMVEHMSYTQSFCKTAVQEQFFISLKDPPAPPPPPAALWGLAAEVMDSFFKWGGVANGTTLSSRPTPPL